MTATTLDPERVELSQLLLGGPVAVAEVELSEGLSTLVEKIGERQPGRLVLVLARLHSIPLGYVVLADDEDPERLWPLAARRALSGVLDRHLSSDGLAPQDLDLWSGGAVLAEPACLAERRRALESAPAVTVIIATRDRPGRLAGCLEAMLSLEYPAFDLLVVDNDPTTSETAALVAARAATSSKITYLREDRRGLAVAHNSGLAQASGTIVAFTDDDVAVDRHWLAELVAPFVTAGVAGASGLILPAELETPSQVLLEAHGQFGKGFEQQLYDLGANRPDNVLFPFAAGRLGSGANMAFDTAWLRGIGGFDAAIGAGTPARGGDDLLALFRLVMSGRTLAYRPGALVWHHHHRESASVRRQVYGYGVGLGAYLTSAAVHEPRALTTMLRRAPAGLAYLRDRREASGLSEDWWPRSLTRLERRGMLYGPLAYGVSRARRRRAGAGSLRPPASS